MSYRYAYIPQSYVDEDTIVWATKALAFARKELELPMIHIKWFVRDSDAVNIPEAKSFESTLDAYGFYDPKEPNAIEIMATLSEYQTQKAVCHEAYHAMQTIKAANMSSDRETTAYEYGDGAMIRLVEMERKGALDDVFFEHLSGKDWGENTKTNANSMSSDTSPEKLYKVYKKRSCAAFICKEKGGYIL